MNKLWIFFSIFSWENDVFFFLLNCLCVCGWMITTILFLFYFLLLPWLLKNQDNIILDYVCGDTLCFKWFCSGSFRFESRFRYIGYPKEFVNITDEHDCLETFFFVSLFKNEKKLLQNLKFDSIQFWCLYRKTFFRLSW